MAEAPQTWARPRFAPGGGDAFLFYVVFVDAPTDWTVSGSRYRTRGFPDGIDVMAYGPDSHPQVIDGFRTGPLGERLREDRPDLARHVETAKGCVVFRGTVPDPHTLDHHRDIIGLVQWLFDQGAVAVLDVTAITWWSQAEWAGQIFDPAEARPERHVVILVSDEPEGTLWLHTRGMIKYGRPDLSIRSVPEAARTDAARLINRFIQFMAMGAIVEDGAQISVEGIPDGMTARHAGNVDDPDFNNRHIALSWPA